MSAKFSGQRGLCLCNCRECAYFVLRSLATKIPFLARATSVSSRRRLKRLCLPVRDDYVLGTQSLVHPSFESFGLGALFTRQERNFGGQRPEDEIGTFAAIA